MGILDRLFGRRPVKEEPKKTVPAAKDAAKAKPVAPKTTETVQTKTAEKPAPVAETTAAAETAPAAVENAAVEEASAIEPAAETTADATADAPWGAHLQKRLDTYFARLRQDFPDGVVVRLNTQHKKLAERGAELRRLIGYEGKLDEFFALGGFTYQRSVGGRPSLPSEQTASVEDRLRAAFPDDVPTVLAVQQADHRLYLDLRAAARKANCTVGEYLQQFKE